MEEEGKPTPIVPFKKQSCFFKYLSYWKELDTPHAIDDMHLEKNVFESTIRVLLDIKNKTKDDLKSRLDLVNQDIRTEIHPTPAAQSGKVDLPGASYNLTTDEKWDMCQWLRGVKVPTGFCSNIKSHEEDQGSASSSGLERMLARNLMQGEIKFKKGQYVLEAMNKIRGNGCILAAHQFG